MSQHTAKRHLIAALAMTAAVGAYAPDASACGGGWIEPAFEIDEPDYRPQGITIAEAQLKKGDYDGAAATVLRVIPHIQNYDGATNSDVINRAMRVLAVATARNDGEHDIARQLGRDMRLMLEVDRDDKVTVPMNWAVSVLESAADKSEDDVVIQSELGEAMAKSEAHKAEGRALLEKLAEKDLLTSPEAYRVLAKLRSESGNADGRTAALERCKAMAKDAVVCQMPAS